MIRLKRTVPQAWVLMGNKNKLLPSIIRGKVILFHGSFSGEHACEKGLVLNAVCPEKEFTNVQIKLFHEFLAK